MPVVKDRSQRIEQKLEWITDVALFVFVICSVISISALQTAYILALVAWIVKVYLQGSSAQLRFPLLVPLGGFALASALATITAVEPYKSLVEFRNVFEAALFYLVVNHVTTEEHATTFVRVLIVTSTLMALYGLSQSVTHGVSFRVHGTMSIYITFADLLMLADIMTIAQLLFPPTAIAQVLCHPYSRHVSWYGLALLTITAALLMTYTRGAWVGVAVGFAIVLGLRKKAFLLALPLIILAVFLIAPQAVKDRLQSTLERQETTAQDRLSMWSSGLHMIRDHPWTGVGMGAMAQVYQQYRDPQSPIAPGRRLGHLHNNVIHIAAERGLLGLAFWLWIWVAYFYHAWLIYRDLGPAQASAKALVIGSLASVVAFHVEGLFEHTFGNSMVITLTYFLMALPFVVQRAHCNDPALVS